MNSHQQMLNEIIDVSSWMIDDNFSPYPEGSRAKDAYFCPTGLDYEFLIAGHRYLFKLSNPNFPQQYWSEIIAYRFGQIIGVPVPPAFAAINSRKNQEGALIQWFYGPEIIPELPTKPLGFVKKLIRLLISSTLMDNKDIKYRHDGETPIRYVNGGNYMAKMIRDFDFKKGKQHNVKHIIEISMLFNTGYNSQDPIEHWSKVFLFDALIGNTDRHQDNWGVVWYGSQPDELFAQLSPAFDNGTSLGNEILEPKLQSFQQPAKVEKYILKGKHHAKWTAKDTNRLSHIGLLVKLANEFPSAKRVMLSTLDFNEEALKKAIFSLCSFGTKIQLSQERADFIYNLIVVRRSMIKAALIGSEK